MIIKREIYDKVIAFMDTEEIALITGPRQAGKTTMLLQLQNQMKKEGKICYFFNLENPEYLEKMNEHPNNLIEMIEGIGQEKKYVFIDEVQYHKNPSNLLKFIYDEYKGKIKLIVTGSSAFYIDKKFKDSLVGRKRIFMLNVFSFNEFLGFKKLDMGKMTLDEKKKALEEYTRYGGYPRVILADNESEKMAALNDIAYTYTKKDIDEADIRKDKIFYKLFRLLANQTGKLVNNNELANTLNVASNTVDNFLYVMEKSFHVHLVSPFFKNIRKELTKMPKIYFNDFGLRNVFVNNFNTLENREDRGEILENLIYNKLLEKYDEININHWRTADKDEVDFVVWNNLAYESKFKASKIIQKNYSKFKEIYPKIALKYIYYEKDVDKPIPDDYINFFDL